MDLRKGATRPTQPTLPSVEMPRPPERPGRRVSPVRSRRRRTRIIILCVILALIGLAVYGVSWVSYLPKYSVGTVTVIGTDQVPSTDVFNYVESLLHIPGHPFLSKDNIFLYNPGAIGREIVGYFPRIATATLSRASLFSTAVTVTVTERQPYALWCTDDTDTDCYEMDDTGFIFMQAPGPGNAQSGIVDDTGEAVDASTTDSTASSTSGQAGSPQAASSTVSSAPAAAAIQSSQQYVFEGGLGIGTSTDATSSADWSATSTSPIGQTFVGAHMPAIVALLQMLGQAGFTPTGATVENAQDFWVPLTQGFYIKASFGEDPGSIVSNLQLVLSSDALAGKESQLQYVDLRFGDRVYYKLQGADETQTSS